MKRLHEILAFLGHPSSFCFDNNEKVYSLNSGWFDRRGGVPMIRSGFFFLIAVVCILFLPCVGHADYLYPGSAAYQPLVVQEPATPDSLFHTWTGDLEAAGRQNLGFSLDFLRNANYSEDWDTIFAVTGSFRPAEKLLVGVTAPYIIRKADFSESDLLDLRVFTRMRLLGKAPFFRISGELSAILPTAGKADPPYIFTLDSPVIGGRLAFAGGSKRLRAGATIGYQDYLATQSGDDKDLMYGIWLERYLLGAWSFVGEIYGSRHTHNGAPGDDEVSDRYFQAGVKMTQLEGVDLGLSVGTGVGSDTTSDIRLTALATIRFGTVGETSEMGIEPREVREESGKKEALSAQKAAVNVQEIPEKQTVETEKAAVKPSEKAEIKPSAGLAVVMIAEGVTDSNTERKIARALQQKGYATGIDPASGFEIPKRNVLLYNPGMHEQAVVVSRFLVSNGYLKDLHVQESPKNITQNWLLLLPGGMN